MYVGFRGLRAVGAWLPLRVAQFLGALLGVIAYAVLSRYRELAWEHLRLALDPTLSTHTCHRIARGVFINLGKTFMEWQVLARMSPASLLRLVEVQGLPNLHRALEQGRGVIALSAHFGNWEIIGPAVVSMGFPGGVLARRLRYPEYEEFLVGMRGRYGVATYARGSMRDVSRLLRANHIIGMMPDQDIDSLEGVFVDFFDRPTYTPVGPAALSSLTGAPIVPCFCIRQGRTFRLIIEEPVPVLQTGDRMQDLTAMTQAWSRVVESHIRSHPHHWVWMHRRWKTQPSIVDGNDDRRARTKNRVSQSIASVLIGVALVTARAPLSRAVDVDTEPDDTATTPADSAVTQQMDGFTMAGYAADGRKRWDLKGTGAIIDGPIVTIGRPNAVGYDVPDPTASKPAGSQPPSTRTAYLTASLAQVQQASRKIRLEHTVTIHTSDGVWLFSPTMYWLPDRSEMVTDQPVSLETEQMLLRGRGATAQTELKHATIYRDVELVMHSSSSGEAPVAGRPGSQGMVTITCDGPLHFDYARDIATFEDHVHVNDHEGDVYSDRLVAYLNRETHAVIYAEALDHVRMVQGGHTAYGQRAVYEPSRGKITLLGSPSLLLQDEEHSKAPARVDPTASLQEPAPRR